MIKTNELKGIIPQKIWNSYHQFILNRVKSYTIN